MGNDYIDEIIDDMLLDGSETADEIKKANEKVTNRYQEMEMKNKANQNVVPFPDYLVGWNLQTLLFIEGKKWRLIMIKTIRAMSKRFGLKQGDIREKCIGLMSDMLPEARRNTIRREEREPKDDLDAIASSDSTRWRFMEILGGLNNFLEANYAPKAPIVAVSIRSVCPDTQRWDIVSQYYRVVDKQIRSLEKEKIADLRQSEPMIRKRKQEMKEAAERLRPVLIHNKDKRKLWAIICKSMPGFTEFLSQLGESSRWKTCFASASRCAMIAAVDCFYHEFEVAVRCIAYEYGLEEEDLTMELHKNQDKKNCFVGTGDEVVISLKNKKKVEGAVISIDMKVETNAKHPEMSVYMVIKEDQGSEGEKTCGIWTNDIESMNVTRFKGESESFKGESASGWKRWEPAQEIAAK